MLPVLDARIRRNRTPRDASEGQYLAGCGVLDCPGVLATLRASYTKSCALLQRDGTWRPFSTGNDVSVLIPAGFVETTPRDVASVEQPAHFQLGNHAAKSRRHAPRRPRAFELDSVAHRIPWAREPKWRDEDGRAISAPHERTTGLPGTPAHIQAMGVPVYITCPEKSCGRLNRITEAHVRAVTEALFRQTQPAK